MDMPFPPALPRAPFRDLPAGPATARAGMLPLALATLLSAMPAAASPERDIGSFASVPADGPPGRAPGPEPDFLAQATPAPRTPPPPPPSRSGGPYAREADHDRVLMDTRGGEIRPLGELMPKAQRVGRGELIGVEPDISRATYRFKYVRPGGNVVWVDMDGRTGKVLDVKD